MTSNDKNTIENSRSIAVVALGGGHGLARTLRAARLYADEITAVVSLGDDGGSSGELRAQYAVAPPGDIRRCLSALADLDSLLGRNLEHRVTSGSLEGHPVGNLLLAGLTMATDDFEASVAEVAELVGAVGKIFPATKVPVTLVAETDNGTVRSQVAIDDSSGICNLRYEPADPPVPSDVLQAIVEADQVVLGPGSFYTSVLASASVPAVRRALNETEAQRVLVANTSALPGESPPVVVATHLDALADHGLKIDVVLADERLDTSGVDSARILQSRLVESDGFSHDPQRLAEALTDAYLSAN